MKKEHKTPGENLDINVMEGFAGRAIYIPSSKKLRLYTDEIGNCYVVLIHNRIRLSLTHANIAITEEFIRKEKSWVSVENDGSFKVIVLRKGGQTRNLVPIMLGEVMQSCQIIVIPRGKNTVTASLVGSKLVYEFGTAKEHETHLRNHPYGLRLYSSYQFNINILIINLYILFEISSDKSDENIKRIMMSLFKNFIPHEMMLLFDGHNFSELKEIPLYADAKQINKNIYNNFTLSKIFSLINDHFSHKVSQLENPIVDFNLLNKDYPGTPASRAAVWNCYYIEKPGLVEQFNLPGEQYDEFREIISIAHRYSGEQEIKLSSSSFSLFRANPQIGLTDMLVSLLFVILAAFSGNKKYILPAIGLSLIVFFKLTNSNSNKNLAPNDNNQSHSLRMTR